MGPNFSNFEATLVGMEENGLLLVNFKSGTRNGWNFGTRFFFLSQLDFSFGPFGALSKMFDIIKMFKR